MRSIGHAILNITSRQDGSRIRKGNRAENFMLRHTVELVSRRLERYGQTQRPRHTTTVI
jgi:hypothetical protein